MEKKLRPRCYFDIDIGHSRAGRIIFELFDDLCPKTTDNFAKLCTGECGIGETTKNKLHYLNTNFHRVIKGFMIQGGDFSSGDGTGGESIYGGRFEDENLETRHDEPYLLSMANCGPNTNGSQFFIITNPSPHLDKKHVVFGRVLSGENLIESIENLPVNNNKPVVDATIAACGVLIPVRKKKTKKDKENCCKSSSEKDKKNKKSKKRKHKSKKKTKTADCNLEEINPNCSVRPDEIPEVPKPFFLYRGRLKDDMKCKGDETYRENSVEQVHKKYFSKDAVGRSGRIIKGRGQLKYLSRSRSETPPHWKKQSQRDDRNNELINQFQNEHDNHERKRTLSKSSSDVYFKKSIFNSEIQDRLTIGKEDEIPRKKKKSDLVLDYKTITEKSPLVNTNNKRNDFKVSKLESVKRDFDKTKRRGSNNSMEQNCMNKDRMESYDSVKITEYSKKKANETDDHVKKRSSNAIKNKDDSHKLVHVRDYNVNTQKSNDSAYIRCDQIRNQSNDSIQRKQVYDFEQKKDDFKEKSNDSMKIKNKHDKQDGDLYKTINSDRIKDGTLRKELIINVKDTSLKNDKIDNKHAKGRNTAKANNKQLNLSEIEHDSQNVNDQFRKKPMLIDYVHRSTSSDHHVYHSKGKSSKEKELQNKAVKSDSSKKIEKSYFNKHEKIIYDYGEESDDSLRQRRNERKHGSKILPGKERNKDDEFKKSVETSDKNLKDYSQKYNSKSKSNEKRNTRSPPAHLVAKWQNRRDIIMTRRSPIARTLNRSRYSPRRYSPRYSTSPPRNEKYVSSHRSPLYKEKVTSSKHGKLSKFKRSRSSSGTIDSSPSSDGSSLITDNNRQSSDIINQDQKTEVVDSTKMVEKNKLTKEAEVQVVLASKEKSIEPVMVIKPIEKPKILSQWKTEEDDSDEKKQQSSILAKLRESDDKKQKSVIVSQKVVPEVQLPKIHSPPISQSISKYRSPSGSRDKQSSSRSSRLSSRSSSRSKRRHRSESSHYRSRGLRYHRGGASRRSTSRSRRARHYSRSHSRSYSSSSSVSHSRRRHYSSRSRSNSSHYDRRRRRQSFRGKGFLSRPYERK